MNQHGHYGFASIRLAVVAVVALLLHVVVPFGYVSFGGPAAPDGELLTRGEASQDPVSGSGVLNAHPGVALAGLIIACAGAALLMSFGFRPLSLEAARWVGAGGGALTAIGATMAWMQSMYHVGSGFATLLTTISGDFRANFWAISPVIIAALSGLLIWDAFTVARQVVTTKQGMRDRLHRRQKLALAALVTMGVTLLVPWTIGLFPDGASDAVGFQLPDDDTAPFFFSAHDVQGVTPEEMEYRNRAGGDGDWPVPSAAIHLLLAFSWIALAGAVLHGLLASAASMGKPGLGGIMHGLDYVPLVVLVPAAILYLLAWFLVDAGPATFLPGFFPLLVIPPVYWMVRYQWRTRTE